MIGKEEDSEGERLTYEGLDAFRDWDLEVESKMSWFRNSNL